MSDDGGQGLGALTDDRPEIEPDCFSSRDLPEDGNIQPLMEDIRDAWKDQVEWGRFTIVNEEYPNEPYPHGLYFEGWTVAPHRHDPPGREAPFSYPLVAASPTPNPHHPPEGE